MIQILPAVTEPSVGSEAEDDCQLLDALVEGGTSVMFLKDVQGRYLRVNQRFEASFDLPREAILGRTDHELFPKDIADAFRKHDLEVMERGVPVEFEEEAPYVDGTHTSIVEKFPWRRADGSLGGVGGLALDITARKRAEAERKELEARMVRAEKLESLGVLAGGVAHDFNNLLAAILANAGLGLAKLEASHTVRGFLEQIESATLRASELTRQMLAYAGRRSVARESVELSSLVGETATLLQSIVSSKAIVRRELAADLPTLQGDATQLRQVVMNLLTNASEALEGASGTIVVRTRLVQATAADLRSRHVTPEPPAGRYVAAEVTDSGAGMTEETQARMFDPFFSTKFTGRGLGLAAVLGIVRAHGGTLQVESALGAEILVLGPGSAKLELIKWVHEHEKRLVSKIIGVETADHPHDRQIVAHARVAFDKHDRMMGNVG